MSATTKVPAGWNSHNASTKPLHLVNAFAYAKSSSPPPDQWTHFATLRPVPWRMVLFSVVIVAGAVWAFLAVLERFAGKLDEVFVPLVVFPAVALYFSWWIVASLLTYRKRTGWPHLHGIGLGTFGVSFRLLGGDVDVPWDNITSVRATVSNEGNQKRVKLPVLRVTFTSADMDGANADGAAIELSPGILGASPMVVLWALLFYWKSPAHRDELGTTVAQQRMDEWLTQVPRPARPPFVNPFPNWS